MDDHRKGNGVWRLRMVPSNLLGTVHALNNYAVRFIRSDGTIHFVKRNQSYAKNN
jgi:hypothetical protein